MWQHPKYIPRTPRQPSWSLCHCRFIATWSSPKQLDVIASLGKAVFKCRADWQCLAGALPLSSGLFLQLLVDSFHLLSLLCSMLWFSSNFSLFFPLSDLSLPLPLHFTHSIMVMKMKQLLHLAMIYKLIPSFILLTRPKGQSSVPSFPYHPRCLFISLWD